MHTPKRMFFGIVLIVISLLALASSLTALAAAGSSPVIQEVFRTYLPLMTRGYSYIESAGILDEAFNGSGMVVTEFSAYEDVAHATALQPDGKILVAGTAYDQGFALVRYNPDGSLDVTFDGDGKATTNLGLGSHANGTGANAIARQRDGKILVVGIAHNGTDFDIGLARFNLDGSLDTSFGAGNGWVVSDLQAHHEWGEDLVLQPDGKIVVAGIDMLYPERDFLLVRYNSDGSLDTSFGSESGGDGWLTTDFGSDEDYGYAVMRQADGKIVVAGSSAGDLALARYNLDGSLDTDFDLDGKVTTDFEGGSAAGNATALDPDGKILVAGHAVHIGTYDFALARYNLDGSLDTSFGAGIGWVVTDFDVHNDIGYDIAVQREGKIVVAGGTWWEADYQISDFALARYNPDGSLDTSFGDDGQVTSDFSDYDVGAGLVLQPDGKVVVAGQIATTTYNWNFVVARYR